jgi:hypothetical protein
MEIEIKRIQSEILEIEVVKEITQPAVAVEPVINETKSNEDLYKAINNFNNLFKK